ncbi:MAG: ABC transporter permease [Microbacteriaceae bacterium]|nr:ABC transporter permease [Microbacteriaceae bacterium]
MLKFILLRILGFVPTLLLVTILVFGLITLIPGDPAVALAGENPTPEQIELVRQQLGLDQPIWQQYLTWLWNAVHLDLGTSFYTSQTVWNLIAARIPVTLSLVLVAIVFAVVVGVVLGTIAAIRPHGIVDRIVIFVATLGTAVPNFWIGLVLILIFAVQLQLLPAGGFTPIGESPMEWISHLVLPAAALATSPAAEIARQTRGGLLDVLASDYVRTARAKGMSPVNVVGKQALKNTGIVIVTVTGLQISRLVGGSVVIESVFVIPGVGNLAYQSVFTRDFPVVQGILLVCAVMVLTINLLVDLSYGYFNPKLRKT